MSAFARLTDSSRTSRHFRNVPQDGVIGQPSLWIAEDFLDAALQADGETRSVVTASSIRRRSAAWTILLDWTFRSRRRASVLWMTRARSFEKRRWQANLTLCWRCWRNPANTSSEFGWTPGHVCH